MNWRTHNPHDPAVPGYFTTLGAYLFVAAQCLKALTAVLTLGYLWDVWNIPELGWINGPERSSGLLPSAMASVIVVTIAALGSAARPNGPGTGKWYGNDLLWTLSIGGVLLAGYLILIGKANVALTGPKLDVLVLVLTLFVMMMTAWVVAGHLKLYQVLAPPQLPRAAIDSFTAASPTVPSGGSVVLNWSTRFATEVEISGVGVVPLNGPLTVRPAGAAGTVVNYTMTARGAGGDATQTVSVTVN
jgi:hypothetical protein